MTARYELAQMNVSHLREPLDSPRLAPFVARLAEVNARAEASDGFIWREKDEAGGDNTGNRPFGPDTIHNLTVWRDVAALAAFTYRTAHAEVMTGRNDWFEPHRGAWYALWWVPAGHRPTAAEAEERRAHRDAHGDTPYAFSFKNRFPPPDDGAPAP